MTTAATVLVIGGSGTTGRYVGEELVKAGATALAASRHGGAPAGCRPVRFDWHDATSWDAALEDVDRLYLIAPSGESEPEAVMRPFFERAVDNGVRRAVLQSSSLIEPGDPGLGRVHSAVAETFPEWAVLRPSWFMQNFTGSHPHAVALRERATLTTATGTGRVGFIDAHDIGRVAAAVLLDPAASNIAPILTGPEALSYQDVARIIGGAAGASIRHQSVSAERMREIYTASGLSADYAAMLAALDVMIAEGAEDRTTDEVRRITGTAPRRLADFAADVRWRITGARRAE